MEYSSSILEVTREREKERYTRLAQGFNTGFDKKIHFFPKFA